MLYSRGHRSMQTRPHQADCGADHRGRVIGACVMTGTLGGRTAQSCLHKKVLLGAEAASGRKERLTELGCYGFVDGRPDVDLGAHSAKWSPGDPPYNGHYLHRETFNLDPNDHGKTGNWPLAHETGGTSLLPSPIAHCSSPQPVSVHLLHRLLRPNV
jgi:hypothetical protein